MQESVIQNAVTFQFVPHEILSYRFNSQRFLCFNYLFPCHLPHSSTCSCVHHKTIKTRNHMHVCGHMTLCSPMFCTPGIIIRHGIEGLHGNGCSLVKWLTVSGRCWECRGLEPPSPSAVEKQSLEGGGERRELRKGVLELCIISQVSGGRGS